MQLYYIIVLNQSKRKMIMTEKEKMTRQVIFQVQQSLYDQFAKTCETNYKKISDVLRELMLDYTKKHEVKSE